MQSYDYSIITELFRYVDYLRRDLPKILEQRNKTAARRATRNAYNLWKLSLEMKELIKNQKKEIMIETKPLVSNTEADLKKNI